MVKLLRCVADVTQSNTEIKARFDEPLIIEPNSKIALLNLRARFPALESEGSFTIVTGQNDTLRVDGNQTVLPPGEYSPAGGVTVPVLVGTQGFDDLLETYISKDCGSSSGAGPTSIVGTDLRVSFAQGKFQLTKIATLSDTAYWDDPDEWKTVGGNPDLTTEGVFISSPTADTQNPDFVISKWHTPNASFYCEAEIDNVNTANGSWELGVYQQGPVFAIGMTNTGFYGYKHFSSDNVGTFLPFDTAEIPQVGDKVVILRQGNETSYQVYRAGNLVLSENAEVTVPNQRRLNAYGNAAPVAYVVSYNDSLELTGCEFTIIEPPITKLRTIATSLNLIFTPFGGVPQSGSIQLANYLGFPTLGPYTEFGDPAVIVSPNLLAPDEKAVGTIVTVDPLVLESYDGDIRPKTKKGRDSILAVLNQVGSLGKTFILDVNFPVSLGIRNANRQTVNQLNFRFKDQSNGETLQFDKDTFLTVLIYGPTESP